MKKNFTLIVCLSMLIPAFSKKVTPDEARVVADNYQRNYAQVQTLTLRDSFTLSADGITTAYVFNYAPEGFVVVSADDAVIPVLAQSNTAFFGTAEQNPAAMNWLNRKSTEIAFIVSANLSNKETAKQWAQIRNKSFAKGINDVTPLIATTWDQGCFYNASCPADVNATAPCGHALTGCVATAMSMIMKYHQFPAKGIMSHSYESKFYGTQTADYAATTYDWASMPNNVTSANPAVATLMYHTGVSVNMGYHYSASGSYSADVPYALTTYFNYDENIKYIEQKNYTQTNWENLIKTELTANRPCFYKGTDPSIGGHAWICDGWRVSDNKFHFNWGWSGASNGYYAMGALSIESYSFTNDIGAIIGIKPGNPNMIARITNISQNQTIPRLPDFLINGQMLAGTASKISLFIDGKEVKTGTASTFSYTWNTLAETIGEHTLKLVAYHPSDTVSHEIPVFVADWIAQTTGFAAISRGLRHISAVNSSVVWACSFDGSGKKAKVQDFTCTENGGATWTTGKITGSALEYSMIYGLNKDTAYAAMFKAGTGPGTPGIYVTFNKGKNWIRQASATFNSTTSFPNVVHFFNANDGICTGDPMNGEFEIYTTSNGGQAWALVPGASIPNPITATEYGTVGHYDALGNEIWLGTTGGRVLHSKDKGLNWTVSQTPITPQSGGALDVRFLTPMHGIAIEKDTIKNRLAETFDGGTTWQLINYTGYYGKVDLCAVPGTANTWVSSESSGRDKAKLGMHYSFDGGHSWGLYPGTDSTQFLCLDFVNDHCGWAGSFNFSPNLFGIFKFVGKLVPENEVIAVSNLVATVNNQTNIGLTWTAPATITNIPTGYLVYRNGVLITPTPVTSLSYNDNGLSTGKYNYCVEAVFSAAKSERICTEVEITDATTVLSESNIKLFQNQGVLTIQSPETFDYVRIVNSVGQVVYQNNTRNTELKIITQQLPIGVYIVQIKSGNVNNSKKILIVK